MASPAVNMDQVEQKSSPLAGPGTSRANRRLQLRKNGFRGRVLPNRNITPKRNISDAWSSPAQKNDTPTSDLPQAESSTRGRSSSILQEVSNSSLRRKDKKTNKHDSVLSVFADENGDDKSWSFESSPACLAPEAPNLTKSRKKHERTQSYKSNPDSDQAHQHIAYLECELAAYQTQLASLTSPSVTKEKGHKIRLLNQDIRRLQDENDRWEAEFDQRVEQVMQEHDAIEHNLRATIKTLESDGDTHVQKVKELQAQLDATRKALDIAEAANVEFEKRLETFAHLLVTSPIKAETPLAQPPFSKESRSTRQKRLSFHRFPTAGSLHQQPALPEDSRPLSEGAANDYFDTTVSDAEWDPSKRESIVSDASRNSIDFSLFMNNDAPASSSRTRPNRRMRRFHGGSHLPKPLILSSAQLAPILPTAPIIEPHESPRAFPFPDVDLAPRRASWHELSPLTGRRRARTNADGLDPSFTHAFSTTSPDNTIPPLTNQQDDTPTPQQTDPDSTTTTQDYSSIGPNIGRNLLEELHAARHDDDDDDDDQTTSSAPTTYATITSNPAVTSHSSSLHRNVSGALRLRHQRSISEATGLSLYPSSRQVSTAYPPTPAKPHGILARIRELLRHPYAIAKRCVGRAHRAFLLSRTINRFQWMLLHVMLGPLATRRLMACSLHENAILMSSSSSSSSSSSPPHRSAVSSSYSRSPSTASSGQDGDASDADSETNSPCPPLRRRKISSSTCTFTSPAQRAKKAKAKQRDENAPMLSRHSPWLWVRFSLTLAFAVACAVKDGPGVLLSDCKSTREVEETARDCGCLTCFGRELRECRR